jgi:beta-glucanase (GH16 family)
MNPLKTLAPLVLTLSSCFLTLAAQTPPPGCQIVWSDEFDGPEIDKTKWAYMVGGGGFGNNEMQWYSNKPENSRTEGGKLVITTLKQKMAGWPYTSAKLTSRQSWTYGRFEVRAKVPVGVGSWPAVWMLPVAISDPTLSPSELSWPTTGEIDIMEHVGFDTSLIAQTFHTGAFNFKINTQKGIRLTVPDAELAFHVYGVDWSPEKADFLLDGEVVYTFENMHKTRQEWPFDRPFYLILNTAVGGDWGGQQGVDNASLPWRFEVDWVRVYRADN